MEARPTSFAFTEARLRKLKNPAEREYLSDARTRGFKIALYPSGTRVFLVYRRVQGRPERIVIGRHPDLSVEEARRIAEQLNGEIARGHNPAEARRQQRLEGTFANLFEKYIELHARPHKRPRSVAENEGIYRRYLSRWGARRLSTITRHDVQRLHAGIGEEHGKVAANRTLALVSSMFNRAADWGWTGGNPASGVKKFREESRERFLLASEMPVFLRALAGSGDTDFQHYVLLGLLTGARSGNLLAMRWNEVDLNEAAWKIGLTKSGKSQVVPLVGPAVEILARRRVAANGEFVFPGKVPGAHRESFRKAWVALLRRSGITNLRPHDVRRSLGSWLTKSNVPLPIIKRALGHADISTTLIYARSEDPELRAALETAATKMLGAGDGTPTAQ
jgi:integrase